jgi:peptide/nickel transport system permease protein
MVDQMVPPVEVDLDKPTRAARRRLRKRRARGRFAFGFATSWLGLCIFVSVFADLLPLKHYAETPDSGITQFRRKPGFRFDEPLGTDSVGRSELSRVIYGLRVSLLLSLGAVALAMVLGVAFGVTAGYLRGWFERIFDLVTDTLLAYPPLMFLLALTAALRPGFRTLTIALMFLAFPTQAKVARANTLSFASREFILAARAMGAKSRRIILREIMPNVALPVMSVSFLAMAGLIVAEGSLSFLGVGIPGPTPALGGMVADGRPNLATSPHLVFVPGVVLLLTVFSLNTVGDRARAVLGLRVLTT